MTCKVFVGNLAFQTTDQALAEAFQDCGKVKSGVVITRGRRSLGYGFVEFEAPESAEEAVKSKNNTLFKERTLKVELASDNPVRSSERSYNNPNPAAAGIAGGPSINPSSGGDINNAGGASGGAGAAPRRRKRNPLPPRRPRSPRMNNPNLGEPQASKSDIINKPRSGSFGAPGAGGNPSKQQQGYEGGGGGGSGRDNNNNPRLPPRRRRPINNNNPKNQNVTDRVLSKTAVFVANLPFGIKDDELLGFFKDNNPKAAHVVVTRNGRSRGYGFVDFATEVDQQNAIYSKNNLIFPPSDRKITVTPSYKTQELAN